MSGWYLQILLGLGSTSSSSDLSKLLEVLALSEHWASLLAENFKVRVVGFVLLGFKTAGHTPQHFSLWSLGLAKYG